MLFVSEHPSLDEGLKLGAWVAWVSVLNVDRNCCWSGFNIHKNRLIATIAVHSHKHIIAEEVRQYTRACMYLQLA